MSITTHETGPFSLRTLRLGEGKGNPLLYVHGYERHPGEAPFLQRLAEDREVVAPELPGYGESTGIDRIRDVHDLALMLRAFVTGLGHEEFDVVGHSLGGMLAAELAVVAPRQVRSLVLVNSYGLWLDDHPMADPFVLSPDQLAAAKWHDPQQAGSEAAIEVAQTPLEKGLERTRNLGTATKLMWPIPDRGLSRRLRYVEARTLVVHGEDDGLVPTEHARELARMIEGADLELLSRAGHVPMFEREDEFVAVVQKFLG
jgi:pimeloyl-ACP methyl ester carboxylesterase